jgi:acylphosphatase
MTAAPSCVGVTRKRVIVAGFVQGVGFRYSLAGRAEARGVAGWVRNRPDGSVEAVLEGAADVVEALVDWCRAGPRGARVDGVEVYEEEPSGIRGFTIAV